MIEASTNDTHTAYDMSNNEINELAFEVNRIAGFAIRREHIVIAMFHYKKNDPAHQPDHAITVMNEASSIIARFPQLEKWRKQIMLGCLFHDTHCHVDRDMHHLLGANHVQRILGASADDYGLSLADVYLISQAVLEHRASWKYPRINPVSNAVASADRGYPDLQKYIRRAVQYRYKRMAVINMNTIISESIEHMIEKFGDDGYAWESYPDYAQTMHGKVIEEIKETLRSPSGRAALKAYAELNYDEWIE